MPLSVINPGHIMDTQSARERLKSHEALSDMLAKVSAAKELTTRDDATTTFQITVTSVDTLGGKTSVLCPITINVQDLKELLQDEHRDIRANMDAIEEVFSRIDEGV